MQIKARTCFGAKSTVASPVIPEWNCPPKDIVWWGVHDELTGANELTRKPVQRGVHFLMSLGRANPAAKKPFNCHHLQALNQHALDKLTAHILNVFTQSPLSIPSFPLSPSLSPSIALS